MSHPDALQARIEALEIKASYADDLLEELNTTIYKQQQQIDRLQQMLLDMQQRFGSDDLPEVMGSTR